MSSHILLANTTLAGRSGTEVVTRDLALGLRSRGHRVSVYAPGARGPLAEEIAARGIAVASDLSQLQERPDIVQGNHIVETLEALAWAPGARGVFVCHDRTAGHSIPPRHRRVLQYVAVDQNCFGRLLEDWHLPADRTRVILNAVDTARFAPRPELPTTPARALVFSHNATPGTHLDVVRAACAPLGIGVDVAGSSAGAEIVHEERLAAYDLVFAKARAALEAMAVGAAVVLCDASGLGPMVTTGDLARLREWNFGARLLTGPLDSTAIAREIARYDAQDAATVSRRIRDGASLDGALVEYERVYDDVMREDVPDTTRTDPADFRTSLGPLLARITSLEAAVAALQRHEQMPALNDDEVSKIRMTVEQAPASMAAGVSTWIRVRVSNGLRDRPLGSWRPFPLQFACKWRRLDAPQPVISEGHHTRLSEPVPPGDARTLAVRTTAPSIPGRYQLRVVLVQEWWRWLDDTPTPVVADTDIAVVRQTLLTGKP